LEKINRQIVSQVAELLLFKTGDPRLKSVTVTRADVSADLKKARVFFSVLGSDSDREKAEAALKKAAGFIRSNLAGSLSLKHVPDLTFMFDKNPEYAQRLTRLLAELSPAEAEESRENDELSEVSLAGAPEVSPTALVSFKTSGLNEGNGS
jgi:ribosome-binding factor A